VVSEAREADGGLARPFHWAPCGASAQHVPGHLGLVALLQVGTFDLSSRTSITPRMQAARPGCTPKKLIAPCRPSAACAPRQASPTTQMPTWLQHLAAWWPGQRRSAAVAAHAGGNGAQPLTAVGEQEQGLAGPGKEHLVVMVHGLFGTRHNWQVGAPLAAGCTSQCSDVPLRRWRHVWPHTPHTPQPPTHGMQAISQLLAQHLDPRSTLLFVSHCNEKTKVGGGVSSQCSAVLSSRKQCTSASNKLNTPAHLFSFAPHRPTTRAPCCTCACACCPNPYTVLVLLPWPFPHLSVVFRRLRASTRAASAWLLRSGAWQRSTPACAASPSWHTPWVGSSGG